MKISKRMWSSYVDRLSSINSRAGQLMKDYIEKNGIEDVKKLTDYAYALASKYGDASSALSCEMYDAIARAQNVYVPSAEGADTATYKEVRKAVEATKNHVNGPANAVSRMVKQAGADTILKNARRDGAECAWIPHGSETCAFCIALASNGWRKASDQTMKGNHADHIHSNCDCEFAIRFDGKSTVEGYDPSQYKKIYYDTESYDPKEKINEIRRKNYANIKDTRNARRRELYALDNYKIEYPDGNIVHLGREEYRALNRYISSESYILNEALRDGKKLTSTQEELVKNLDSALDKLPTYNGNLSRSVYFYNGNDAAKFFNQLKEGEIFKTKAYMSTTCDEKFYNKDAQVQIFINNSKKGVDLTPLNKLEKEVLYKRKSLFKILKKEEYKGKYYIILGEK